MVEAAARHPGSSSAVTPRRGSPGPIVWLSRLTARY